ncbi:MAG TPA: tRNA (adenosine(37)-N6)-threonylcarbamoyltransferase complex dimerization subunit type 1 TsaB [Thermoanaerobaculia bacterium]|nr:tRNA (adenosine(37)-N6)-threonylcarbamoyltransferase complex dimerization subunit type 1 TsaB [Thermoanaerobaculia bacterium]
MTERELRLLCLDTASPLASVALCRRDGGGTTTVAQWSSAGRHSSSLLLARIDDLLETARWQLGDLDGLIGLAGPGSFTGTRVGLATLFGLHQGLKVPAVALPTTRVLAQLAPRASRRVLAAVDALRDEWYVEEYSGEDLLRPQSTATLMRSHELARQESAAVIGFGVERLAALEPSSSLQIEPALALAPVAPSLLADPDVQDPAAWDAFTLLSPIYARTPAMLERRPAR